MRKGSFDYKLGIYKSYAKIQLRAATMQVREHQQGLRDQRFRSAKNKQQQPQKSKQRTDGGNGWSGDGAKVQYSNSCGTEGRALGRRPAGRTWYCTVVNDDKRMLLY
jgi:hypothetical protein